MRQSGSNFSTSAPAATSVTSPAVVVTLRPSIFFSRSSTSLAIRSITFCSSARSALSEAPSRTARSAQSALRPRFSARLRM